MKINAEGSGIEKRQPLGDQPGDNPRQHVPRARRGQPGVGKGADAAAAVRGGDDGMGPFEDDGLVPLRGEPSGEIQPP